MKAFFRRQNWAMVFMVMLCAAFLCTLFERPISKYVQESAPYKSVTVSSGANHGYEDNPQLPIKILDAAPSYQGNPYRIDFATLSSTIVENNGFLVKEDNQGNFFLEAQNKDAFITFRMRYLPQALFTIPTGEACDTILMFPEDGEMVTVWNPVPEDGAAGIVTVYPFRAQLGAYHFFQYLAIYGTLFLLLFFICYAFYLLCSHGYACARKLGPKPHSLFFSLHSKYLCVAFFIGLFGFFCLKLITAPGKFFPGTEMGSDTYYYMNGPFFNEEGELSLQYYMQKALLHRGLYQMLMYLAFKLLSSVIGFNPIYLHFFIISLVAAVTFSFFVPMLYKALFSKKMNNTIATILLLFFVLYYWIIMGKALSDTLGCFFLIIALALFIQGFAAIKNRFYIFSGIFFALAANWRSSFGVVGRLCVFILLFVVIYRLVQHKKQNHTLPLKVILPTVSPLLFFIGALLLTQVPQALLYYIGGANPFPSTNITWITDYANNLEYSIVEVNLSQSFEWYTNFTDKVLDQQLVHAKSNIFSEEAYLTLRDFIYVCVNNPLQYIVTLGKRIFWSMSAGFSTKFSTATIQNYLFTYALQISVLFSLFCTTVRKKIYTNKALIFLGLSFLVVALPQAALAFESRYMMFSQFVLLLFALGAIFPAIVKDKEVREAYLCPRYVLILLGYVLVCIMAYFTIAMNFIVGK